MFLPQVVGQEKQGLQEGTGFQPGERRGGRGERRGGRRKKGRGEKEQIMICFVDYCRHVIHTVGPRFNLRYKTAAESALYNCYRSVMQIVK